MATAEFQVARISLRGREPAQVVLTYDDVNLRLLDFIVRNPLDNPLTIRVALVRPNGNDLYRSAVVDPGETVVNVPGNQTLSEQPDPETGLPILVLPFSIQVLGASAS